MSTASFSVPTEVVTGVGSLNQLPSLLARYEASKVAIAVDAALVSNGLLDVVLRHSPALEPVAILPLPANPDVQSVEECGATARARGANAVVAIGGGSALGGGKAVAIRLTNDAPISAYEGVDRVPNRPAPTIAIPTTAGSGSEVSNALVLHEEGRPTELVVRGRGCEPRAAILDASLLRALPESPLVYAALDALVHCLESLWASAATSFTTSLALQAADRLIELLPLAVAGVASGANRAGENDAVLQQLLEASCAANMACGNSGLGLVHALASAADVKLAHGLQTGLLLPHVAAFNAESISPSAQALLPRIRALYDRLDFEPSFTAVSPEPVRADVIVRATQGHPFRANNIRPASDEEVAEIAIAAGASRE